MFDDQQQNPQGGRAGVPGNLPLGEPEDIFGAMPEAAPKPDAVSALSSGVLKPRVSAPPPPPAQPVVATPPPMVDETASMPVAYPTRGPRVSRAIMIIVIVLVAAAVVGGVAWYAYRALRGSYAPAPSSDISGNLAPVPALPAGQEQPQAETANTSATATTAPSTDEQVLIGGPVDSDGDGLSDYDEVNVYHTDPHNWDTDGDGLSDYDEAMIWHTDPKNSDTDHDGYVDGVEVKNGFNPNGPGKIFEPPKTKTP